MTTSDASSTSLALDASAAIEILLENRYAATGRGLHEKLSSAEGQIDELTVKRIRYIASARNAVVHRRVDLQNPDRFYKVACESIEILSGGDYSTPIEVLHENHEEEVVTKEKRFNKNKDTYLGLWFGIHKANLEEEERERWINYEAIKAYGLVFEIIYLYCCIAGFGKIAYGLTKGNAFIGLCGAVGGLFFWIQTAAKAREIISNFIWVLVAASIISFFTSLVSPNNSFVWISFEIIRYIKEIFKYLTNFK